MKSSLKKLRVLANHHHSSRHSHKNDAREKREQQRQLQAKQDELLQASQDMQDMNDCYDSLLSAAAATANSAYEFSEALQEMGTCLLEKTSLNDDEESGKALLMLGKVQFILQKLVDNYRAHVIQTIATPSESLLKELQTVEEMKRQCDYKRDSYNFMVEAQREKGKSKNTKGETISLQQLQSAQEEYEEEAALFIFRLKSLKQGQSRSLLTQAARHHASQLNFFRKGFKALEVVEPHVKTVAEEQHIDYHFSGLENDDDDDGYSYDGSDDGELSFDYGQTDQGQDVLSTSKSLMEVDTVDYPSGSTKAIEPAQEPVERSQAEFLSSNRVPAFGSQSAPLFPNSKIDSSGKIKEMQLSSTKKFLSYALPTPAAATGGGSMNSVNSASLASFEGTSGQNKKLWLSSPLEPDKFLKSQRDHKIPNPDVAVAQKVPPPLAEELSVKQLNSGVTSDAKKIKRYAFSGPMASNTWSSKSMFPSLGPRHSVDFSQPVSSMSTNVTSQHSISSKISPSASPPPIFSPRISELHELPRPPISLVRPTRPSSLVGHSAPLVSRGREQYTTSKPPSITSHRASPLPVPPMSMTRSFSIPSSGRTPLASANTSNNSEAMEDVTSPTLTPMLLPSQSTSELASQATKKEGLMII